MYYFGLNAQREKQGQSVEPREAPEGLQQALEWDLGPLPPHLYDKEWSARRRYAVSIVSEFRKGVDDAKKEKGGA